MEEIFLEKPKGIFPVDLNLYFYRFIELICNL